MTTLTYTFPKPKKDIMSIHYEFDWTWALAEGSETMLTKTFTVMSSYNSDTFPAMISGLPIQNEQYPGKVKILITGGVAGHTYLLGCTITTSGGQVLYAEGLFSVV
jgi:hypothetical protein